MANIDYKEGGYSIPALSTQQFTFWWGRDSRGPHEYFDVFVSPELNIRQHPVMKPLTEEHREYYLDATEGPGRHVLLLTLRNNNDFIINFVANHVRIYP